MPLSLRSSITYFAISKHSHPSSTPSFPCSNTFDFAFCSPLPHLIYVHPNSYEIHDKIQNFMPPIPRETWTDDQITKLFSKLGGDASASASAAADVDRTSRDTEKEQPVALGGLRVFG